MKCYACEATFRDNEALRNHKIQMREEEYFKEPYLTHVYCHYCDQDFVTERAGKLHWDQFHAEKQDINCPGCNKHFVHFSVFVRHVELHECPVISQETAAARCQKELDFAKALDRIDQMGRGVNRTRDFTSYLGGDGDSSTSNHLPARSAITSGPSAPWPSELQVLDESYFPRLPNREYYHGNTNLPDLLAGDETNNLHGKEGDNPWALTQPQFPNVTPTQRSTQEQALQLQLFNNLEHENEWQREERAMKRARGVVQADPDDPNGRDFDPSRLFCPYTKMYQCPRCKKSKGFKNWPALKRHMESAAHAFTKFVTCPCCKDTFKHLFSLAAHVESANKKCDLKHSDVFEIFLGQLTWNLVEVAGEHKSDGTTKFAISKKAEHEYGVVKPLQRQLTFGYHHVPGSEPVTDRPQLTSSALSQLEQQPDKPLPRFKAPQQQLLPLQQRSQPQQAQNQTWSGQNQTQVQAHRSRALYGQQYPSLQQQQQPQVSEPQARCQDRPRPAQQQPPQRPAQYQIQHSIPKQPQSQRPQAQQQPGYGGKLTELALAQVPSFPSEKRRNSDEQWSDDGDGDAGW